MENRVRVPARAAMPATLVGQDFVVRVEQVDAELVNDSYIVFQFHDTGRNPRAKLRYLQHDAWQKRAIVGTLTEESHTLG